MKRLSLLTILLALTSTAFADGVFIANKDLKLTSISADDAKNILLGNKVKTDDGVVIKLSVLTDGPVHEKIIRDYTQRSTDQFEKYWKKQVFTGKGIMPNMAKSDSEQVDYVGKTSGAFGYADQSKVTGDVVVVSVK